MTALLGRVAVGVVFLAHGLQKWDMGLPLPTLTALFLMVVETVGAIFFVHLDAGLTGQGGYELVLVLGAAALALGFNGGRFSLDHLVVWGAAARGRPSCRTRRAAVSSGPG